jgi:hypothetical protein
MERVLVKDGRWYGVRQIIHVTVGDKTGLSKRDVKAILGERMTARNVQCVVQGLSRISAKSELWQAW